MSDELKKLRRKERNFENLGYRLNRFDRARLAELELYGDDGSRTEPSSQMGRSGYEDYCSGGMGCLGLCNGRKP
jgi:hypothetical protein